MTIVQAPSDPEPGCSTLSDINDTLKKEISNYEQRNKQGYNALKQLQAKKSHNIFAILMNIFIQKQKL